MQRKQSTNKPVTIQATSIAICFRSFSFQIEMQQRQNANAFIFSSFHFAFHSTIPTSIPFNSNCDSDFDYSYIFPVLVVISMIVVVLYFICVVYSGKKNFVLCILSGPTACENTALTSELCNSRKYIGKINC